MNVYEYREAVKQLFRSGKATEKQWHEMAETVCSASDYLRVPLIDATILADDDDEEDEKVELDEEDDDG